MVVWLMTTVGGVWFFLFLVRRPHGDDDAVDGRGSCSRLSRKPPVPFVRPQLRRAR